MVQEEATRLLLEETDDVNVCTSECPLNQKSRHFHCRMVSHDWAQWALPVKQLLIVNLALH